MTPKSRDRRDDGNAAFDPEPVHEDHRPGVNAEVEVERGTADGHHRFKPSEGKDVPRESLAERIRRASEGG
jgi:hypothetical protein